MEQDTLRSKDVTVRLITVSSPLTCVGFKGPSVVQVISACQLWSSSGFCSVGWASPSSAHLCPAEDTLIDLLWKHKNSLSVSPLSAVFTPVIFWRMCRCRQGVEVILPSERPKVLVEGLDERQLPLNKLHQLLLMVWAFPSWRSLKPVPGCHVTADDLNTRRR